MDAIVPSSPNGPETIPMTSEPADPQVETRGKGWLASLGLDRPELRAWAMYDWANSAMVTTIIAAVFPIYFSGVAGANLDPEVATRRFALASTLGMVIIAILAPVLGTIADARPIKKRMLG